MKTIIVICGPTASGKTDVAIKLAKKINGEIISCDSRQIYKYMDIGTNKPSKKQLKMVPHYLISILKLTENFTTGDFVRLANKKIREIFRQKKTPIMVCGTGLYIKALIDGLIKIPSNKGLRKKLNNELKKYGIVYLYKKLKKLDYETAKIIDRKNPIRIIRALEICLITGKKFSQLKKETKKSKYNFLIFGLLSSKNSLYKKINIRVDKMIKKGLVEETAKLVKKYSSENCILQNTIGYGELVEFLNGKLSKKEATNLIKQNTRHYAKRQLTWFNKDSRIVWVNSKNDQSKKILNYLRKSDII
ncbi:MAG: tRNA (adenosine(37)-N6)-dimethylallyltransferase MiaA [Elusimicrobiota bacterium]